MKHIIVLFVSCTLASCIAPARFREVEAGVYEVYATGSVLATESSYMKKIDKKARKVCDGEYEEVNPAKKSVFMTDSYVGVQPLSVPGSTYSKLIRCK